MQRFTCIFDIWIHRRLSIIGWNLFYIQNNYVVPRPSTAMFSQNCSSTISISSPESLTVGSIDWFVAFCSWVFVRANADSSGSFTLFSTAKKMRWFNTNKWSKNKIDVTLFLFAFFSGRRQYGAISITQVAVTITWIRRSYWTGYFSSLYLVGINRFICLSLSINTIVYQSNRHKIFVIVLLTTLTTASMRSNLLVCQSTQNNARLL